MKSVYIRYLVVGGTAYLTEMGALYILKKQIGLGSVSSVAISFWIGFVVAFTLQKTITFQNYDRGTKAISQQLAFYSLLIAWNYAFTLVAVKLFEKNVSVFVIRTLVIMIVTSWNFITYRWLFSKTQAAKI
jgi:putative flippase GtrA